MNPSELAPDPQLGEQQAQVLPIEGHADLQPINPNQETGHDTNSRMHRFSQFVVRHALEAKATLGDWATTGPRTQAAIAKDRADYAAGRARMSAKRAEAGTAIGVVAAHAYQFLERGAAGNNPFNGLPLRQPTGPTAALETMVLGIDHGLMELAKKPVDLAMLCVSGTRKAIGVIRAKRSS